MKIFYGDKIYLQEYDILILDTIPPVFLPDFVSKEVAQIAPFCREKMICSFNVGISSPSMMNWIMDVDFILEFDEMLQMSIDGVRRLQAHFDDKIQELEDAIEDRTSLDVDGVDFELEELAKEYVACGYIASSLDYHLGGLEGRHKILLPPGYNDYKKQGSLRA